MIQELRNIQQSTGATVESVGDVTVPVSFGNDVAAIQAARQAVALVDLSHWGLLKLSGDDRLRFLHNQSTNDIQSLKPGQGCDTVFVTSTARTIDLATVYVTDDAILVLVSPHRRQQLMEWLDRYLFPMDRVELKDISSESAIFNLVGPNSDALLQALSDEMPIEDAYASHQELSLEGFTVRVAVGNSLALPGYTLIVSANHAANLWQVLVQAGSIPMGDRIWEQLRIQQGRPVPNRELTEDYNPLEAGLWQTISFTKGCYIGQETIARLNTYKGVKQQLWGVRLQASVEPGTEVMLGDEKIGKLTSVTETENSLFGLVYIRTKAGGKGLKVKVKDVEGEVVDVPFLSHSNESSQA
jgi:tRNA-modifying protein YgfZ